MADDNAEMVVGLGSRPICGFLYGGRRWSRDYPQFAASGTFYTPTPRTIGAGAYAQNARNGCCWSPAAQARVTPALWCTK